MITAAELKDIATEIKMIKEMNPHMQDCIKRINKELKYNAKHYGDASCSVMCGVVKDSYLFGESNQNTFNKGILRHYYTNLKYKTTVTYIPGAEAYSVEISA